MFFEFTLTYMLPEQGRDTDLALERLAAAGCTDALVGTGLPGCISLQFTREAESAQEALGSALEQVKACLPQAELKTIQTGADSGARGSRA